MRLPTLIKGWIKLSKLYKTKVDEELYYYFLKNGEKRWMYRHKYYDALGERQEKKKSSFKTEKAGLKALLEVKASLLDGQVKKVENDQMTVAQWLDIWYETYSSDWKETTQIQRKNSIKHQMKPLLGKYKLSELDRTTYRRVFINKLLKTHQPRTVSLHNKLFKTAINAAVEDEIITRNRFNKVNVEFDKQTKNFLTPKELNKFLATAKSIDNTTNYTVALFLAYTGVRRGEVMGLMWKNINFKKKTITIERTRDNKGVRTPKTKRSYRTIIIDEKLINQLKKYKKWCKETMLSFGLHIQRDDFVFISYQSGTPISENTIKYSFERIIKKAKIKRITPHGLRHTHATILINNRVPVTTIADRLGNTPQMIFDVYAHAFKEMEKESVEAFSQALNI